MVRGSFTGQRQRHERARVHQVEEESKRYSCCAQNKGAAEENNRGFVEGFARYRFGESDSPVWNNLAKPLLILRKISHQTVNLAIELDIAEYHKN